MDDELVPCSYCGSEDIGQVCHIEIHTSRCYYFCGECGTRGPGAPSQEQARAAWIEQQVVVSTDTERGESDE